MYDFFEYDENTHQYGRNNDVATSHEQAVEHFGEENVLHVAPGVYACHEDERGENRLAGLLVMRMKAG